MFNTNKIKTLGMEVSDLKEDQREIYRKFYALCRYLGVDVVENPAPFPEKYVAVKKEN